MRVPEIGTRTTRRSLLRSVEIGYRARLSTRKIIIRSTRRRLPSVEEIGVRAKRRRVLGSRKSATKLRATQSNPNQGADLRSSKKIANCNLAMSNSSH